MFVFNKISLILTIVKVVRYCCLVITNELDPSLTSSEHVFLKGSNETRSGKAENTEKEILPKLKLIPFPKILIHICIANEILYIFMYNVI